MQLCIYCLPARGKKAVSEGGRDPKPAGDASCVRVSVLDSLICHTAERARTPIFTGTLTCTAFVSLGTSKPVPPRRHRRAILGPCGTIGAPCFTHARPARTTHDSSQPQAPARCPPTWRFASPRSCLIRRQLPPLSACTAPSICMLPTACMSTAPPAPGRPIPLHTAPPNPSSHRNATKLYALATFMHVCMWAATAPSTPPPQPPQGHARAVPALQAAQPFLPSCMLLSRRMCPSH